MQQSFLSILRGINVSGQKKISMLSLKKLYESIGFKNVRTYIQSGNVVFDTTNTTNIESLIDVIEKNIKTTFGFDVPVQIRTNIDLVTTIQNNPFLIEETIQIEKLHVTFLKKYADEVLCSKLQSENFLPDRFVILEKEVFLYCPNGYGNTKLTNSFFERKLKVSATTRNWRTVNALAEIMHT